MTKKEYKKILCANCEVTINNYYIEIFFKNKIEGIEYLKINFDENFFSDKVEVKVKKRINK